MNRKGQLEQHGGSVQALLSDVQRRLLMAMLQGGMNEEIKKECAWKLTKAMEDLNKLPDRKRIDRGS
jgi:predicted transcriptional regulator